MTAAPATDHAVSDDGGSAALVGVSSGAVSAADAATALRGVTAVVASNRR